MKNWDQFCGQHVQYFYVSYYLDLVKQTDLQYLQVSKAV